MTERHGVRQSFCASLDRLVIRCAAAALDGGNHHCHLDEAIAAMSDPAYLDFPVSPPRDFSSNGHGFRFRSAVPTSWAENNTVYGKIYPRDGALQGKPTIILLHGWNGERGYYLQFPYLRWRLNKQGLNVAMLELPYHAQRKPSARDAVRNFISSDLFTMVQAAKQAVADIRTLAAWLRDAGSGPVGLWGISLGAWLGGLAMCYDNEIKYGAMLAPVVSMEQAVRELEFCAPVRKSIEGRDVKLDKFNLVQHRLRARPENVLIVYPIYDQFAPVGSIDEVRKVWGQPALWRVPHGHISVLGSVSVLNRIARWLAQSGKGMMAQAMPD